MSKLGVLGVMTSERKYMGLGTVIATLLQGIRRSDDSLTVSPAIGGEAMNLEGRMKRSCELLSALERPTTIASVICSTMYRGWGSGAADYLLEKYDPAALSPEYLEAKKNAILDIARHSITKLPGLLETQQRELDELVAIVVGTAFDATLRANDDETNTCREATLEGIGAGAGDRTAIKQRCAASDDG